MDVCAGREADPPFDDGHTGTANSDLVGGIDDGVGSNGGSIEQIRCRNIVAQNGIEPGGHVVVAGGVETERTGPDRGVAVVAGLRSWVRGTRTLCFVGCPVN